MFFLYEWYVRHSREGENLYVLYKLIVWIFYPRDFIRNEENRRKYKVISNQVMVNRRTKK